MSLTSEMKSYEEIRSECLRSGKLFEDSSFDAVSESIFVTREPPRPFVWKRPKEICTSPKLFVGGASRLDIEQGMLGDCWFLASVSSLVQHPKLLRQVVSEDQGFSDKQYCGAFLFNFWDNGSWKEVIVDDRLPTYNNKLVFLHSKEKNEFWGSLLEKAYAKLHGSYEGLKSGQAIEAMEDFTGGLGESIKLKKAPKDLFDIMKKASDSSLMSCSIEAKANEIEAKGELGLIKGHAYTVTKVIQVLCNTRRGKVEAELVRVRNPWGNEREWKGRWSDKSAEWNMLYDKEKEDLGLTFEDDGEFWMDFNDFKSYFDVLDICHIEPSEFKNEGYKPLSQRKEFNKWISGISAGGCRNFIDTFALNPQFRVTLTDSDDNDDKCTLIVALMQGRKKMSQSKVSTGFLTIGFSIYKVTDEYLNKPGLDKEFFQYHASTARSHVLVNSREVVTRFNLDPGVYAIIPCTFNPNEEGKFMLRIFSEKPVDLRGEKEEEMKYTPPASRHAKLLPEENKELDAKFKEFFSKISGTDSVADVFEIQKLLTRAFKKCLPTEEFDLSAVRTIVAEYAKSLHALDYDKFKAMYKDVKQASKLFRGFDTDNSLDLTIYELFNAIANIGFNISRSQKDAVLLRYGNKENCIKFDDFCSIYMVLKKAERVIEDHVVFVDGEKTSQIQMSMDELVTFALTI